MIENSPFSSILVWLVVSFYVILLLLVISKLSSFIAFKQTQRWLAQNKTLIHEYGTSPDLTPVEFGYLFDRKFRDNELLALIITMHQNKILKLESHKGDLTIEIMPHKKAYDDHSMLEMEVMSFLRANGGSGVWSDIASSFRAGDEMHERFERFIHHALENKGYFIHGSLGHYRRLAERYQSWIGALLSAAFVLIPVYQSFQYSRQALGPGFAMVDQLVMFLVLLVITVCLWPAWYLYVGLAEKIIYHGSGIPYGATSQLKANWRLLYGYKVFLHVVERNRLKVDPNIDDKVMPWCVAAGIGPPAKKMLAPKNSN